MSVITLMPYRLTLTSIYLVIVFWKISSFDIYFFCDVALSALGSSFSDLELGWVIAGCHEELSEYHTNHTRLTP